MILHVIKSAYVNDPSLGTDEECDIMMDKLGNGKDEFLLKEG